MDIFWVYHTLKPEQKDSISIKPDFTLLLEKILKNVYICTHPQSLWL